MPSVRIACVVEGQGDEAAVPALLRRLVWEQFGYETTPIIPRPVRVHRHKILRRSGGNITIDVSELARAAELAARNLEGNGIVCVILDADEDLPCEVGPALLKELQNSHGHLLCSVILPLREFEAWFIAAADSLRGNGGLREDIVTPKNPESIADAKGWLSRAMGRRYSETVDQQRFASRFDMSAARRTGSFDKMWRDVNRLVGDALWERS